MSFESCYSESSCEEETAVWCVKPSQAFVCECQHLKVCVHVGSIFVYMHKHLCGLLYCTVGRKGQHPDSHQISHLLSQHRRPSCHLSIVLIPLSLSWPCIECGRTRVSSGWVTSRRKRSYWTNTATLAATHFGIYGFLCAALSLLSLHTGKQKKQRKMLPYVGSSNEMWWCIKSYRCSINYVIWSSWLELLARQLVETHLFSQTFRNLYTSLMET